MCHCAECRWLGGGALGNRWVLRLWMEEVRGSESSTTRHGGKSRKGSFFLLSTLLCKTLLHILSCTLQTVPSLHGTISPYDPIVALIASLPRTTNDRSHSSRRLICTPIQTTSTPNPLPPLLLAVSTMRTNTILKPPTIRLRGRSAFPTKHQRRRQSLLHPKIVMDWLTLIFDLDRRRGEAEF